MSSGNGLSVGTKGTFIVKSSGAGGPTRGGGAGGPTNGGGAGGPTSGGG